MEIKGYQFPHGLGPYLYVPKEVYEDLYSVYMEWGKFGDISFYTTSVERELLKSSFKSGERVVVNIHDEKDNKKGTVYIDTTGYLKLKTEKEWRSSDEV